MREAMHGVVRWDALGLAGLALTLMVALTPAPARAALARAADEAAPTGRRALVEIGLPEPAPAALDSIPHPWPGRATLLSAAGTLLPFAVLAGADDGDRADALFTTLMALEVVTPAAGHLYGGLPRRALVGMGVRAVGFAMATKAISAESYEFDATVLLAIGGVAVTGLSALVDVVTVSSDVDRANHRRLRERVSLGVRATPSGRAPALALTARF
jgi:hypothetical protein